MIGAETGPRVIRVPRFQKMLAAFFSRRVRAYSCVDYHKVLFKLTAATIARAILDSDMPTMR